MGLALGPTGLFSRQARPRKPRRQPLSNDLRACPHQLRGGLGSSRWVVAVPGCKATDAFPAPLLADPPRLGELSGDLSREASYGTGGTRADLTLLVLM